MPAVSDTCPGTDRVQRYPSHPVAAVRNIRCRPSAGASMQRLLSAAVCLAAGLVAPSVAQSDLDAWTLRVLNAVTKSGRSCGTRSHERETLQITALAVLQFYGFERKY